MPRPHDFGPDELHAWTQRAAASVEKRYAFALKPGELADNPAFYCLLGRGARKGVALSSGRQKAKLLRDDFFVDWLQQTSLSPREAVRGAFGYMLLRRQDAPGLTRFRFAELLLPGVLWLLCFLWGWWMIDTIIKDIGREALKTGEVPQFNQYYSWFMLWFGFIFFQARILVSKYRIFLYVEKSKLISGGIFLKQKNKLIAAIILLRILLFLLILFVLFVGFFLALVVVFAAFIFFLNIEPIPNQSAFNIISLFAIGNQGLILAGYLIFSKDAFVFSNQTYTNILAFFD